MARSEDGVHFEPLITIGREMIGTESLERPSLVRTETGTWRLYLSCATPGTKHWRVELVEAAHPAEFDALTSQVVLPGDAKTGVKDPVIVHHDGLWQLWASCHPLADPDEADQMVTDYATSPDGKEWTWHGTALNGRPGYWDSRGARVTAVMHTGGRDRRVLRRPGQRRGELRGAHRHGHRDRAHGADPDRGRARPPSRRTAAGACATWTSCRSATAATGCTTR